MNTVQAGGAYTGGFGSRREARERALGLLYEAEAKGAAIGAITEALPLAPDEFTAELIAGVEADRDAIDQAITNHSRGWSIERMPMLDRSILRLATFELMHRPEIPTGAVISEALELAKRFSTGDSAKFVNGVLSAIADEVRK